MLRSDGLTDSQFKINLRNGQFLVLVKQLNDAVSEWMVHGMA
jgi:hypothetical protein